MKFWRHTRNIWDISMIKYVMGVDHGGTKTSALIADHQGRICTAVTLYKSSEPSYERSSVTVRTIKQALKQADLLPEQITYCTVGYSGADWDFEFPEIQRALSEATGIANMKIVNDCIGAMRGGTQKPYGGVICIGTGLNIGLINCQGESFVYGYLVNEEDSGGVALGQRVIRAVRNAYTGVGRPTILTQELLNYFQEEKQVVLETAYDFFIADSTGSDKLSQLRYEVKDLAPLLLKAADGGDEIATEILEDFCTNLKNYVLAAAKRLSMMYEPFELILSGGVLKGGNYLRHTLERKLQEELPNAKLLLARYEPVCGDVLLSYDALCCSESIKEQFQLNCEEANLRCIK